MYYLVYIPLYLLSLLPFWILYGIADILYILIYFVFKYRRGVVSSNLLLAFPEKTKIERQIIERKFYRNFADMWVETIKLLSINRKTIEQRLHYDGKVIQKIEKMNRPFQIQLGHFMNWEWGNFYVKTLCKFPFLVTYKPIKSKTVNRLFLKLRSRFGSILIPFNDPVRAMRPYKGQPYISILIADQNVAGNRKAFWFSFMNKKTPFYRGPEIAARRDDLVVVFGGLRKVKRGHYQITMRIATDHIQSMPKAALTEAFVQFMEDELRAHPENWLWSHKRWKRDWNGEINH